VGVKQENGPKCPRRRWVQAENRKDESRRRETEKLTGKLNATVVERSDREENVNEKFEDPSGNRSG